MHKWAEEGRKRGGDFSRQTSTLHLRGFLSLTHGATAFGNVEMPFHEIFLKNPRVRNDVHIRKLSIMHSYSGQQTYANVVIVFFESTRNRLNLQLLSS